MSGTQNILPILVRTDTEQSLSRSCSVQLSEIITSTCEADWTDLANVTLTHDATVHKVGTNSVKMIIAAGLAAGGTVGYGPCAPVNINLATAGYTHIKFWIYADAAQAAGAFAIGLAEGADDTSAEYCANIPALPVLNTWYRVLLPLTAAQLAFTSVSTIVLKAVANPATPTIYLDDIRLCNYDLSGDDGITMPDVTTQDGETFEFPFTSRLINVYSLPQAVELTWYQGTAGEWTSSDVVCGTTSLAASQTAADLERQATSVIALLGADLAAGEKLKLEVVE
ncbi:MAG: hypothetical protein IMZ62_14165 [Chloroflexi bacterium]|nr:hypothetical protein [Chloroflexota bacterium]